MKKSKLGDISIIKGGKRLPKNHSLTDSKTLHPYIKVKDMCNDKVIELDETFEYIGEDTYNIISNYYVNKNDIIISIVGTIGNINMIGSSLNNANLTENCVKITELKEITNDYLYYYLSSPIGKNEIQQGIVGAVQKKLPIKNIKKISIEYPNTFIQSKIVKILSSIDQKIELNKKINNNSISIRIFIASFFTDYYL